MALGIIFLQTPYKLAGSTLHSMSWLWLGLSCNPSGQKSKPVSIREENDFFGNVYVKFEELQ